MTAEGRNSDTTVPGCPSVGGNGADLSRDRRLLTSALLIAMSDTNGVDLSRDPKTIVSRCAYDFGDLTRMYERWIDEDGILRLTYKDYGSPEELVLELEAAGMKAPEIFRN